MTSFGIFHVMAFWLNVYLSYLCPIILYMSYIWASTCRAAWRYGTVKWGDLNLFLVSPTSLQQLNHLTLRISNNVPSLT